MKDKKEIKEFVQKTLGCGCPEEVFKIIEYHNNILCGNFIIRGKINIGNRLLVYIFDLAENSNLEEILPFILREGRQERDKNKYNRFRLVLAVDDVGNIQESVYNLFNKINNDEKIHIHIIDKKLL